MNTKQALFAVALSALCAACETEKDVSTPLSDDAFESCSEKMESQEEELLSEAESCGQAGKDAYERFSGTWSLWHSDCESKSSSNEEFQCKIVLRSAMMSTMYHSLIEEGYSESQAHSASRFGVYLGTQSFDSLDFEINPYLQSEEDCSL